MCEPWKSCRCPRLSWCSAKSCLVSLGCLGFLMTCGSEGEQIWPPLIMSLGWACLSPYAICLSILFLHPTGQALSSSIRLNVFLGLFLEMRTPRSNFLLMCQPGVATKLPVSEGWHTPFNSTNLLFLVHVDILSSLLPSQPSSHYLF